MVPDAATPAGAERVTAQARLAQELASERAALHREMWLVGVALAGFVAALIAARLAPEAGLLRALGFAVAYVAAGYAPTRGAVRALWRGKLSINMLMVLAALAAAAVGEVRDGAILLLLFSIAEMLESYAMGNTKRAVASLMKLKPDTATLVVDGEQRVVAAEDVSVGAVIVLKPGERVPLDGTVISGAGAVDQSPITGESAPIDKVVGDAVFAGSINRFGSLAVRVTKDASASTLARMIELVTAAQAQRAPSQRFSAWFGQRYTRLVLVGSVLALLAFLALGVSASEALYKAATLLVVASPCAVVISVPAAILAALARSARMGVLFKGGAALEDFGSVTQVAIDKTGTLTTGAMRVAEVIGLGVDESEVLDVAAALESASEHPVAQAIVAAQTATGRDAPTVEATGFQALPGLGVTATLAGEEWWAGNRKLAEELGADLGDAAAAAVSRLEQSGMTTVVLGRRSTAGAPAAVVGAIGVADTVRNSAAPALRELGRLGVKRVALLTGDNLAAAGAVADRLGIEPDMVAAELLPEDKVAAVAAMREHGKVAFVGDGVNDAAAIATADVGIAMGAAGTDAALEAADVALLSDDLGRLPQALQVARRANLVIRQNLSFSLGIMLLMVLITLFGDLPLPLAVLGHEGGTILVVLNGLRLLAFKPRAGAGGAAAGALAKEPALQG